MNIGSKRLWIVDHLPGDKRSERIRKIVGINWADRGKESVEMKKNLFSILCEQHVENKNAAISFYSN